MRRDHRKAPIWHLSQEKSMKFTAALCTVCILIAPAVTTAGPPDVETIRDGAIKAAGGFDAFKELGILHIVISDQETTIEGRQRNNQSTAYVDAHALTNLRLEMSGNVVLVRTGGDYWATREGQLEDRPQTSRMVRGTLNQRLFPLLLPFTLAMDEVTLSNPQQSNFEGEPAWRVAVDFPKNFFIAPSMNTTWYLYVRKADFTMLGVEFIPPPEVRAVRSEGIRYRPLKWVSLGSGAQLPAQVLLDGIDIHGAPTGHVRVTNLGITVQGGYDPTLFIDPDRLQQIEDGMD
jgi:hypothetical protein